MTRPSDPDVGGRRTRPVEPCSRCSKLRDAGFDSEIPGGCGYCHDLSVALRRQRERQVSNPPLADAEAEAARRTKAAPANPEWTQQWGVCTTCRAVYLTVLRAEQGRLVAIGPERPPGRCAECHTVVECLVQFAERRRASAARDAARAQEPF